MSLSSPLKTLFVAALFGAGLSGAAFAQDSVVTAKLATPTTHAHVVADNAVWNCQGDTCQAIVHHSASVFSCHQLVRVTGALTAYGAEGNALTDEQLASCNGAAAPTQTAQTSQPQAH